MIWMNATAYAMGLMLTPLFLTVFGNTLGQAGIIFLAWVLAAGIFQIFNARLYHQALARNTGVRGENELINQALGPAASFIFPLCARLVLSVALTTSLLATSGFVFNEVFAYWFPNFGFAFFLLCTLFAINLVGQKAADIFQIGFVLVAASGLLLLSILGFIKESTISNHISFTAALPSLQSAFLALLLFTGFELSHLEISTPGRRMGLFTMVLAVTLAAGLFLLWGMATLRHTPMESLATTTVPYMRAARHILGQEGRLIMGSVLIAGTCAAVNSIFVRIGRYLTGHPGLLNWSESGSGRQQHLFSLLLLAGMPALLMLIGAAGSPWLELFVRAGLVFWILHYAVVHLSAWSEAKRDSATKGGSLHLLFSILLATGCLVLIRIDDRSLTLTLTMAAIFAAVSLLAFFRFRIRSGFSTPAKANTES